MTSPGTLAIDPHPLLDVRGVLTTFLTPLENAPPELRLCPRCVAPLQRDDAVRRSGARAAAAGRLQPTGRSKPGSEYLLKAVRDGALASINLAVACAMWCRCIVGLPISVVDLARAARPFQIGLPQAGIRIPQRFGATIDLGDSSACSTPRAVRQAVKDAQRTKTTPSTRKRCPLFGARKRCPGGRRGRSSVSRVASRAEREDRRRVTGASRGVSPRVEITRADALGSPRCVAAISACGSGGARDGNRHHGRGA